MPETFKSMAKIIIIISYLLLLLSTATAHEMFSINDLDISQKLFLWATETFFCGALYCGTLIKE